MNTFETLAEITKPEQPILSHLQNKAIAAHRNVSFSPERRGEQMIKEYSEELNADILELTNKGIESDKIADYKSRYEKFFNSYLHAKSNTFSVMITGAGNFPIRKHQKANRSEQKHYEVFREWRERAKKAICRKPKEQTTYISELDRYKAELAGMQKNHELMKKCNAIIKKAKGNECTKELIEAGLSESNAIEVQKGGNWYGKGFASFQLTNNNANMKRVEQRIKEIEQKEQMRTTQPETEFLFEGGKVVMNYEADRIQIFFDTRPTKEQLNEWKQKGLNSFNWSPSNNCWQRKITNNAIYSTKHMFAGKLTKAN